MRTSIQSKERAPIVLVKDGLRRGKCSFDARIWSFELTMETKITDAITRKKRLEKFKLDRDSSPCGFHVNDNLSSFGLKKGIQRQIN